MSEWNRIGVNEKSSFLDAPSWTKKVSPEENAFGEIQIEKEERKEINSSTTSDFSQTLKEAFNKVNALQKEADHKIQAFVKGENKNIPEVMISLEKAELAMKLMLKVRNKMVEAYQEVMRMQI